MQLLTTSGYKKIEDCAIGEQLIAYDITDGSIIINQLLDKKWFSADMFEDQYSEQEEIIDENGEVVIIPPYLIKTKEEIFSDTYGSPVFYVINGTYTFSWFQSIWVNMNISHVSDVSVGDVIYDDDDQDVIVTSIKQVNASGWWRLSVSGDHSYIADNITLHNATRYWVGGGASANWNATGNTNWGSSSGGTNNASVPTSVDDVIFDGAGTNGNTNSTISATITILSLDIQTGYTSTMTHNARLTIAGNWTFTGNYTIAGISEIVISAASTITSNGVTWTNNLLFGNSTFTLNGNLTIGGIIGKSGTGTATINATISENISANGISQSTNVNYGGTAKIILTGGTWFSSGTNVNLINPVELDGNVTLSGTPTISTSLKYVSGTIITTGSTLIIRGSCTFDTAGISFNNVEIIANPYTITLLSNLNIDGLFITRQNTIFNKTISEVVNCNGGITSSQSVVISGTADIYLKGGTLNVIGAIANNLYIDGNVTISGTVAYQTQTLTYLSGTVTTTGSTLQIIGSCTLNTSGITWNNITSNSTTKTITLTSNLSVGGLLTIIGSTTINRTTAETVTLAGGLTASSTLSGTAKVIFTGGTWSGNNLVSNDVDVNGNITISGNIYYGFGAFTYISGNVRNQNAILNIGSSCSMINMNKVKLNAVVVTAAQTVTMNQPFIGTEEQICQVSSTGANYTIAFTDTFEKIARNVAISGATLSRPMQMIVATNPKFNTNRSTNIGLRYINQSPNGFAKNNLPIADESLTGTFGGIVVDPLFVKQG